MRQSPPKIISTEQPRPLGEVLKPRVVKKSGKSVAKVSLDSSDSEKNNSNRSLPKKTKPIQKVSKESPQNKSLSCMSFEKMDSTEIAEHMVFNEQLRKADIQNLFQRASEIGNLKYDKFSEKIRQYVKRLSFTKSFEYFQRIIKAFQISTCSVHLLVAVFTGFSRIWVPLSLKYFFQLQQQIPEKIFFSKIGPLFDELPIILNGKYANFMSSHARRQQDITVWQRLQVKCHQKIDCVYSESLKRKIDLNTKNKILSLYSAFGMSDKMTLKQLLQIIPISSIPDIMQVLIIIDRNRDRQNINQPKAMYSQKMSNTPNDLIDRSIDKCIEENNLKEAQKLMRHFGKSLDQFPHMQYKLQRKYIEYIERTNRIQIVDLIVYNKLSLIKHLVAVYESKHNYRNADHFIHKYWEYLGRQSDQQDLKKVYKNPLIENDSFGPTETHVYNQKSPDYFLTLRDFSIHKKDVLLIDASTIDDEMLEGPLKQLQECREIGFDSENSSGIHVFDKARLQLLQLFCPTNSCVYLFDVASLKKDKKARWRKNKSKGAEVRDGKEIITEEDFVQQPSKWVKFTNLIEKVFMNATIYGHVLHGDIKLLRDSLNVKLDEQFIKIKDSQMEFKKAFPKETKSNLNYLCERIFGKPISKFEQCSAWDYRPLRKSQKHYAALDAVLPYKLVKQIENVIIEEKVSERS